MGDDRFGANVKYAIGLFYILLVAVIQAISSTLVQYLYTVKAFESPFLLTYIGVSLFTWPLPLRFFTDKLLHSCFEASVNVCRACKEATDFIAPDNECQNCAVGYVCQDEGYVLSPSSKPSSPPSPVTPERKRFRENPTSLASVDDSSEDEENAKEAIEIDKTPAVNSKTNPKYIFNFGDFSKLSDKNKEETTHTGGYQEHD